MYMHIQRIKYQNIATWLACIYIPSQSFTSQSVLVEIIEEKKYEGIYMIQLLALTQS